MTLFTERRRKKLYQKHYPLWGGLTNMNLNVLWPQPEESPPVDYFRAVSTGPVTPLVVSITSIGQVANVGLTYRSTVFGPPRSSGSKPPSWTHLSRLPTREVTRTATPAAEQRPAVFRLRQVSSPGAGCAPPARGGGCLHRPAAALVPGTRGKDRGPEPMNVTAQDVQEVLSHAPAPRVVNIHGGVARVIPRMVSFSEFLIGMGYPAVSLTNPSDGTYSFSCYETAKESRGPSPGFTKKRGCAR